MWNQNIEVILKLSRDTIQAEPKPCGCPGHVSELEFLVSTTARGDSSVRFQDFARVLLRQEGSLGVGPGPVQAFFFLDYLWCFVFFVICGSLGLGLLVGKLRLVLAQCLIISLETFHQISKTKRITLANEYERHKLHSPMLIYSCWGGVLQRNLVNAWWFDWCVVFCVALLYRCVLHFEGPDDCALVENFFPSVHVFCWESCCVFPVRKRFGAGQLVVTLKLQVPQFWGGWQNVEKKLWKFAARHDVATMTTRLETWNQESLQFVSVATSCFGKNRPLSFSLQSSSSPEAWCAETMFWVWRSIAGQAPHIVFLRFNGCSTTSQLGETVSGWQFPSRKVESSREVASLIRQSGNWWQLFPVNKSLKVGQLSLHRCTHLRCLLIGIVKFCQDKASAPCGASELEPRKNRPQKTAKEQRWTMHGIWGLDPQHQAATEAWLLRLEACLTWSHDNLCH